MRDDARFARRCRRSFTIVLVLLAGVESAAASELEGVIEVAGASPRDAAELVRAVVWFVPDSGVEVKPAGQPFEIVSVRKSFEPRVLAVPQGSTVRFPNQDPILHNVFSASGRNRFDLGLYRLGESREVTFEHPGVVRVFCNVHHDMVAYVVVLETPFHASPGPDGRFRLDGLPPGPGKLTVWHERAEAWTGDIEMPRAEPLRIRLDFSKQRVPQHMNKFGKPYTRDRGRGYR